MKNKEEERQVRKEEMTKVIYVMRRIQCACVGAEPLSTMSARRKNAKSFEEKVKRKIIK